MWHSAFLYLQGNYIPILIQARDHILLSLLSVLIAGVVGIYSGYQASKSKRLETMISGPFNVLRVIPSLAILILLIPLVGTGTLPAAIALTILAIPPIFLNTIVGFKEVPFFMVETARGMGMTQKQILWKVRVPLALPMIFTGLRTALVEVVASATLAGRIGAGGLGEIIFTGLSLSRTDLLLIGGLAVAILSLASGFIFDLVSRHFVKYKYL